MLHTLIYIFYYFGWCGNTPLRDLPTAPCRPYETRPSAARAMFEFLIVAASVATWASEEFTFLQSMPMAPRFLFFLYVPSLIFLYWPLYMSDPHPQLGALNSGCGCNPAPVYLPMSDVLGPAFNTEAELLCHWATVLCYPIAMAVPVALATVTQLILWALFVELLPLQLLLALCLRASTGRFESGMFKNYLTSNDVVRPHVFCLCTPRVCEPIEQRTKCPSREIYCCGMLCLGVFNHQPGVSAAMVAHNPALLRASQSNKRLVQAAIWHAAMCPHSSQALADEAAHAWRRSMRKHGDLVKAAVLEEVFNDNFLVAKRMRRTVVDILDLGQSATSIPLEKRSSKITPSPVSDKAYHPGGSRSQSRSRSSQRHIGDEPGIDDPIPEGASQFGFDDLSIDVSVSLNGMQIEG